MIDLQPDDLTDRTTGPHISAVNQDGETDVIGIQISIGSSKGFLREQWIPYNSDGIYKISGDYKKKELLQKGNISAAALPDLSLERLNRVL